MSCNGCRILRKGCSHENCIFRQSLQGIHQSPQAQANATLFLAKFYGRATLISFLSSIPQSQRPALFQSLLYEACGRTVNPVTGVVGLLSSGNWHLCQAAVEKVFQGGVLPPLDAEPDHSGNASDGLEHDVMHSARLPARMSGERGGWRVKRRRAATPQDETVTTTFHSCSEYNNNNYYYYNYQSQLPGSGRHHKPLLRRFL